MATALRPGLAALAASDAGTVAAGLLGDFAGTWAELVTTAHQLAT